MVKWKRRSDRIPCSCKIVIVLFLVGVQGGFGLENLRYSGPGLPENHEVRLRMIDQLYAPIGTATSLEGRVFTQRSAAHRVMFEVIVHDKHLYSLFINEIGGEFTVAAEGNYIVRRSLENGSISQVKIFTRSDAGCFVRVFPFGERSKLDLFVYGYRLQSAVVLPIAFREALAGPFAKIVQLTQGRIDWTTVLHRHSREGDRRVAQLVAGIRGELPKLRDADDGAMDAEGRFVLIETGMPQAASSGLNCSGFVKWIIDGYYGPLTGQSTAVEQLKQRNLEFRGHDWSDRHEIRRDPYFGLDWSRNLALLLEAARSGATTANVEAMDVRVAEPLAYIEDVGYPCRELEVLLFYLAQKHPGYFYVGSLNRDFGEDPILRQHYHLVALFPHFLADGTFVVDVFERNRETSLESLYERYGQDYIHLVRVESIGAFKPPEAQ